MSIEDYEHLEKLAFVTGFIGLPKINKKSCVLSFNGKWYVESLEKNFGIKSRKTFDISISNNIPKELQGHFIRGYFDGDGCVTQSAGYAHIGITSGSNKILEQIKDFFYDNGVVLRTVMCKTFCSNGNGVSYGY